MTEATHFSQCVHDQQRRLEADSIRCAQLISGGRRCIRPPCTVPRSRSPTMRCIRLVILLFPKDSGRLLVNKRSPFRGHSPDKAIIVSYILCQSKPWMAYANMDGTVQTSNYLFYICQSQLRIWSQLHIWESKRLINTGSTVQTR